MLGLMVITISLIPRVKNLWGERARHASNFSIIIYVAVCFYFQIQSTKAHLRYVNTVKCPIEVYTAIKDPFSSVQEAPMKYMHRAYI